MRTPHLVASVVLAIALGTDRLQVGDLRQRTCAGRWDDGSGKTVACAIIGIPALTPGLPVVSSIVPACGPRTGGTPITILGFNFNGATSAMIGGSSISNFVVVDDTRITGVTTPGSVGVRDVAVTSPLGSATLPGGYAFHQVPFPPSLAVNGGFESGSFGSSVTTLQVGSSLLPGWTVSSGDIQVLSGFWQNAEGLRSLDLSGNTPGRIEQFLTTIPQRTYLVTFMLAGDPAATPFKTVRVEAAGQSAIRTFDATGFSYGNMGWSAQCWSFTATGTATALVFESLTPGGNGPALDDVKVIGLSGPLRGDAPGQAAVGSSLVYAISTMPPAPWTPYLFDVSFDGDVPGIPLPPPLGGVIPLNPTYLYLTYGLSYPSLFSGFIGFLDASGEAFPAFHPPFAIELVGLDLHAACLTFDPVGPLGIGEVSNSVLTRLASPAPTVAGVAPPTGSSNGGEPVTISGFDFLPGAAVDFSGDPATGVVVVDAATITCLTPARPGGPAIVRVTNPGGPSGILSGAFTYFFANPAPAVNSVAPPDGPIAGGAPVTISGTGFLPGAAVRFGALEASQVVVTGQGTITCLTPPGALGPSSVTVTNADTQSGTLAAGFTYLPDLALASVAPPVSAPGTPATVTGAGFQSGLVMSAGAVPVVPTSISPSSVTFPMPAGAACSSSVTIANPSGQQASLPFNPAPFIAAAPVATGPAAGGGSFFLIGQDFHPGTTVTVGGNPAAVVFMTLTAILCTALPGALGPATIVVSSPSGCVSSSTYVYH